MTQQVTNTLVNQRLDNQAIFDKALFGIRSQDYQKSARDGHCVYRGYNDTSDNLKCAIGHCIDDETAKEWDSCIDSNGTVIDNIYEVFREDYDRFFTEEQLHFLTLLQEAHDTLLDSSPDAWEAEMSNIANQYGLTYTPTVIPVPV